MLAPSTPKMWVTSMAARCSTMWSTTRYCRAMHPPALALMLCLEHDPRATSVHPALLGRSDSTYRVRRNSTLPSSTETTCTAAIWSSVNDVLPTGDAVMPANPTHVATWVWLPSRPTTTIASLSPASPDSPFLDSTPYM